MTLPLIDLGGEEGVQIREMRVPTIASTRLDNGNDVVLSFRLNESHSVPPSDWRCRNATHWCALGSTDPEVLE
jgi:hypothetical protein